MLVLRPYQIEAIEKTMASIFSKEQKALLVAPTGCGKTEVMIGIIKRSIEIKPDIRVCILINRIKLIEQTKERFSKHFETGIFCRSLKELDLSKRVTVASIHSLDKQYDLERINLLFLDEAHNLNIDNEESRYVKSIKKLQEKNDRLKIVGLTATPYRATGNIYGKDKLFKSIDYRLDLLDAIKDGHLVKPKVKHTEKQFDTSKLSIRGGEFDSAQVSALVDNIDLTESQVRDAMPRLVGRRKIFWMAYNIKHAETIKDLILKIFNQEASLVTSQDSLDFRKEELDLFETGPRRHCVFVSILSEGYNYPPADALVLIRPIKSPTLYVQTCGRVLRPYPGKEDALILDYGEVVKNCGPLNKPTAVKNDFAKRNKSEKLEDLTLVKSCKNCMSYQDKSNDTCLDCGAPFEKPKPKLSRLSYDGEILDKNTKKTFSFNCRKITATRGTSRAGNQQVVIEYLSEMFQRVKEYFPVSTSWGPIKLLSRCKDLGINPQTVDVSGNIIFINPVVINYYVDESGYDKISSIRKADRDSNAQLAGQ